MRLNTKYGFHFYLNPDFKDICELAKEESRVIRFCVAENNDLLIAEGYYVEHDGMAKAYGDYMHKRYPLLNNYMLYRNVGSNKIYLDTECVGGENKTPFGRWKKYISQSHIDLLLDLIRELDYSIGE